MTLVGLHFETVLELSFMVMLLQPEELRWIDLNEFIFTPGWLEEWLQHIGNILDSPFLRGRRLRTLPDQTE
ncbi:hypothetical protein [Candidatus Vondammii sp. HM_W22]|uniref:hypothetical protein n=1 Tax=Candidatus Vondammii sp. HM_W22 TaxID=2687299 RepID=UPI001F13EA60|nr:hypothetical protein [Candidatus Vondammii sp. HM_W22]